MKRRCRKRMGKGLNREYWERTMEICDESHLAVPSEAISASQWSIVLSWLRFEHRGKSSTLQSLPIVAQFQVLQSRHSIFGYPHSILGSLPGFLLSYPLLHNFHRFAENSKSRNVKSGSPNAKGMFKKILLSPVSQVKWIPISKSLKKLTVRRFWKG